MNKTYVVFVAALLAQAGCARSRQAVTSTWDRSKVIAVLPVHNMTNSMDGADIVRRMVQTHLGGRGFQLIGLDAVDGILKERFGITDGGQLNAASAKQLGGTLNVQALLYTQLETFRVVNLGFLYSREVGASFKLVEADSGKVLWTESKVHKVREGTVDRSQAKRIFGRGLLNTVKEKVQHQPLFNEASVMVEKAFVSFPN